MLNPPEPGSYGQIGMIEHNGNLATMYQLPDGSRAFSDGESWLQANKGDTSFTRTEQISFQEGSNITNQGPGAGYTEPWRTGGGGNDPSGGRGQGEMFPNRGPIGGGGGRSYTVYQAVDEFIKSPASYGTDGTTDYGKVLKVQRYLEGLSPQELNTFMNNATENAVRNQYFNREGGICIGCGVGTIYPGNLEE